MKKWTLLFILFGLGWTLQAQNAQVQAEVQEWATTYEFDEEQLTEANIIIARKHRNLAQIKALEERDINLYKRKHTGIISQTKVQLHLLMTSKQSVAYEANEKLRKDNIRQQAKELLQAGGSKEEVAKLLEQLKY